MAYHNEAPYKAQDVHEVSEMLRGLEASQGRSNKDKGKTGFSAKKNTYTVQGSNTTVDSWRMQDWDYKKPNLPTYARGLFTAVNSNKQPEIVVRGYDKFFNQDEVNETQWRNVEHNTRGPYELSVKENGCIIFISGMEDGTLIVCSKHSTGPRADTDISHAVAGEKWVDRHLATVGKTRRDLAMRLRSMNATAVAELCDDDFEEHVLQYSPEQAGLYLHGINLNLPEFATYPHHLVDQFADEWGMKKTMYLTMDDIGQVKAFLDKVAETGNYAGRDTEGFVIRCQSQANTNTWHDWFFKYKFEEPYLMYRQWRECTKAIIADRQPKYKKHKKITEEYIDFARRQLHGNPQLAESYNANHGIIKMRNDFLAFRGLNGADIIRQEREVGEVANDEVTNDVVLVPVATLGCGKTTVALALCKLFGWGHIQNDNITVRKGKPAMFAAKCCETLTEVPAMVADRNNHQRRERKQLIDDISKIVPTARFVALHYVHEQANYDNIRQATRSRIMARGDNHQTIHASTKGSEIIDIMEGFMYRFEQMRPDSPPDDGFDTIIDLDVLSSSRENLETVITRLYTEYPKLFRDREMPTSADMDAAIAAALNNYTVEIKHEIKGGSTTNWAGKNAKTQPNGAPNPSHTAPKPKERKVEYFAVQLPATRVAAVLEAVFRDATPEQAAMYNALKASGRVQREFHVTLIHRASSAQHPETWAQLNDLHARAAAPTAERAYVIPEPQLGIASVRLERIVWDKRIMTFVVRLAGSDGQVWRSVNATAHVTVGTSSPAVKPKESNDLLEKWLAVGSGEGSGIMEVQVKGSVELEGVVKGVLGR